MMPVRRRGAYLRLCIASAFVLLGLTASACTAPEPSEADPYTFDAAKSAVDVDTPALRQQKQSADIAACPRSKTEATPVDGGLPDLTLPCLGGGRDVHLAGLRGTPVVLNLWAQYCGPCREEAPLFQRLHEEAADDLLVLGLDWQDTNPGKALAFADELGLTYPQTADPEAVTRAPLRVSALPMTVLIDSDGVIVDAETRVITTYDDLTQLVQRELGVQVSG